MIDYERALEKANQHLRQSEIPLRITHQGEFSEGWFFCFDSAEYVETGNVSAQLAGNGPFLVDRDTGELHVLGTAKPLQKSLGEYALRKRRA